MAITVKHTKVSTIPDGDDSSLIRPSDWNADHQLVGTVPVANGGTGTDTLTGYVKGNGTSAMTASSTIPNTDITGLGTMSTQNANNVNITGGSISGATVSGYIPTSAEGVPNGVATLDSGGQIPISQIPPLGDLNYQGTWNASTNTPTLTSSVGTKGYYYVVSVAGSTNLDGITDWQIGDWAVYNGSAWQKIDNTDAVTSVNGYTGTVVLTQPDIAGTVPTSRTISTGTGLTGGGDLSANRTISFSTAAVGTWAATPSSANLAAAMTDETGSGSLVFGTGPTLSAPVIDGANPYIQFNNGSAVTVAAGKLWYDGSTGSWNAGMGGGNITQQIGEELFVYGKASSAITDSPLQIIYQTGAVGASGVIQFAPTVAGITNGDLILGVATENIALNGFGRVTSFGVVHGITTNGTAFGETWADGDTIWYNPVTGNPTNVKPVAPNIKVQVGTLIKAGSGGSGSIQVEINHGSVLGGTDSNVQLTSVTNGNILTYDGANAYWKNTDLTAGTGISVSKSADGVLTVTNTSPSSGGTVTSVTAGTGLSGGTITTSGTIALANTAVSAGSYTNASITVDAQGRLTSASSGAAPVTSVSGTAGNISSTGGTTPVLDLVSTAVTAGSYTNANITVDAKGRITSASNGSSSGVTSVTGTSPVVSSGGTTPAISLASGYGDTQNPYASKTANYVLAAPDGSAGVPTFRALVSADIPSLSYVSSVGVSAPLASTGGLTPTLSIPAANGTTNGYLTSTDWTTFNNKGSGTVTSITAGTGLSGGTITGSGTIALANTTVTAGSYTYGSFTVDAQGRLTAAANGTAPVTSVSATAPLTSTGGTTPTLAMPAASASANGYLTSTDWSTFNSKGSGTVTSVSGTGTVSGISLSGTVTSSGSLTLGGTLDLSSPPAIGGTTANLITGTTITATKYVGISGGTF